MIWFWSILLLAGIVLQLLIIAALLKGPYRDFGAFFVYAVTLFLLTVADAAAYYSKELWTKTSRSYWINDAILQLLVFVLVISLVHRGMGNNTGRAAVRRVLVLGALLLAVLSLYFTKGPVFGLWMTRLSRNLGFCAVILNLILWAVLIRYRHTDRRLLLISGGLGIEMAGKAIGHSLREISVATRFAGNLFIVLSSIAGLCIWWQAFRKRPVART